MPTNLPPEYFEVEQRYRAARSPAQKIALLEELISTIPKHKGTDKLRADLRRRLAEMKSSAHARKGPGRTEAAYHLNREGAGQVAVVGPPNTGKSALVAALTHATPEVAEYPYTTRVPVAGMMPVADVQVQLVDTPALDRNSVEPALLDLIRHVDLVLLVVDLQGDCLGQVEETMALLKEHRIASAQHHDHYPDPERMVFVPILVVVNKNDDETTEEDAQALCELIGDEWCLLPVSAATGRNLERLKEAVFERLDIIRVYAKPPGKEPDFSAPFVLKRGSTVEDLAAKVHKDFVYKLSSARLWGSGAFDGQMVGRDHVLQDRDVVELRT